MSVDNVARLNEKADGHLSVLVFFIILIWFTFALATVSLPHLFANENIMKQWGEGVVVGLVILPCYMLYHFLRCLFRCIAAYVVAGIAAAKQKIENESKED
jgi:hypothetical protein